MNQKMKNEQYYNTLIAYTQVSGPSYHRGNKKERMGWQQWWGIDSLKPSQPTKPNLTTLGGDLEKEPPEPLIWRSAAKTPAFQTTTL